MRKVLAGIAVYLASYVFLFAVAVLAWALLRWVG